MKSTARSERLASSSTLQWWIRGIPVDTCSGSSATGQLTTLRVRLATVTGCESPYCEIGDGGSTASGARTGSTAQANSCKESFDAIEKAKRDANADEEFDTAHEHVIIDKTILEPDRASANELEKRNDSSSVGWIVPYVEATLDVPAGTPIHETSLSVLTGIVVAVVEVEGPIHRDEVARRITSLWGLQRTGARIAEAISKAVESGIQMELLRADADFVTHSHQTTIPVRCRTDVNSASLRKPEMIPPSEVRQTILHLMAENVGVGRDEIQSMVVRALGFGATGAKLKHAIERDLERMVEASLLLIRDEKFFLSANSTVGRESAP